MAAPTSRRGGVLKHRHDMSDESVPPYGRAREIRHLRSSVRNGCVREEWICKACVRKGC